MAVACSIFTLDGWAQLFWAAFDMPVTGLPLEVALGCHNWHTLAWLSYKEWSGGITL